MKHFKKKMVIILLERKYETKELNPVTTIPCDTHHSSVNGHHGSLSNAGESRCTEALIQSMSYF